MTKQVKPTLAFPIGHDSIAILLILCLWKRRYVITLLVTTSLKLLREPN